MNGTSHAAKVNIVSKHITVFILTPHFFEPNHPVLHIGDSTQEVYFQDSERIESERTLKLSEDRSCLLIVTMDIISWDAV